MFYVICTCGWTSAVYSNRNLALIEEEAHSDYAGGHKCLTLTKKAR